MASPDNEVTVQVAEAENGKGDVTYLFYPGLMVNDFVIPKL